MYFFDSKEIGGDWRFIKWVSILSMRCISLILSCFPSTWKSWTVSILSMRCISLIQNHQSNFRNQAISFNSLDEMYFFDSFKRNLPSTVNLNGFNSLDEMYFFDSNSGGTPKAMAIVSILSMRCISLIRLLKRMDFRSTSVSILSMRCISLIPLDSATLLGGSAGFNSLDEMYFFDSAYVEMLVFKHLSPPFANTSLKKDRIAQSPVV